MRLPVWCAAIATALCVMTAGVANAQTYPSQTVKIIVPFASGGPIDLIGRPLAQKLSEQLGATFVVENRPGANGVIGAGVVANSEPDGTTMLLTTGSFTANPSMVAKLPYDPVKDFAPVTQLAESYGLLLMVPAHSPYRTFAELAAAAKKSPDKLNYAMTGFGNITHVAMEYLKSVAGIALVPVPYKGTAESITAMLGSQVDMSIVSTGAAVPYMANQQLRALGITGQRRAPNMPDIPTFKELGYSDVNLTGLYGLWFPAGTPRDRVELIQRESKKALESPEMQRFLADSGFGMVASTPDEFAAFVVRDIASQAAIIKRIGLQPK